ncbi:MAG: FAD-dependent oxidoreductase [Deltaproteobacteria bacterium]|nr:FAD-dependent oxidoreductase [Deltaproteobacteria bacterium]
MPERNSLATINAKGLYYKALNRQIRACFSRNQQAVVLRNVLGQRYIGCGLSDRRAIEIHGTPGQDLGAFMNGTKLIVYGNAQDGVGNTMNDGKIIVHGKVGEIPGHSMRGGKIFIKGDVEYRAGIHMKEYLEKIPVIVIGGTAKDYCGEYMAGGRIIVLNLDGRAGSPVGSGLGTGIHGGAIYVRGAVEVHQLGIGAVIAPMDDADASFLKRTLDEYAADFGCNLGRISSADFTKITKKGHRPFGNLYSPAMNLKTTQPRHFNLTPPCAFACPTGIPTPVFFNLIKDGQLKEAQLLMDEYTPFRMSVCGAVCPAPCMEACSRNALDGPVAIQELARTYYPSYAPVVARKKHKELISIIGAGPAGLSAAWQLARRGYRVRVYEKTDNIGGKIRRAIPKDRLPDEILEKDIRRIRTLPIEFFEGTAVDSKKMAFIYDESDAVVVATGAQLTKKISYPGGERILPGLSFLTDINDGRPMDVSKKEVVIIGAGNVGMDIACEAWRLGASKVTALDIQKPLAFGKELETAKKRGTKILWPKFVSSLDEKKIHLTDGSPLKADVVIFSIGEVPDASYLPESVYVDDRGYIKTAERSFQSNDPKVFGCGDIVKQGLATDAVGSGRLAAMEIDGFLRGGKFFYPEKNPVGKRRIRFAYFGGEEEETDRCISCGTCIFCDRCVENCPQEALSRNGEIFTVDSERCTLCYTCVGVCPRGVIQTEDLPGATSGN